ncbi:hypothetical protein IV203_035671 [Nitzschia inconspicua]|uniref:Uncharacterized protein n=1 Tax=Nitzschia inconspicua TaxID=303405 RepID=A0A9K3LEE2_9STRA|nr:hypothetical protein IV203_035671 [Nitzschia inconspicua]
MELLFLSLFMMMISTSHAYNIGLAHAAAKSSGDGSNSNTNRVVVYFILGLFTGIFVAGCLLHYCCWRPKDRRRRNAWSLEGRSNDDKTVMMEEGDLSGEQGSERNPVPVNVNEVDILDQHVRFNSTGLISESRNDEAGDSDDDITLEGKESIHETATAIDSVDTEEEVSSDNSSQHDTRRVLHSDGKSKMDHVDTELYEENMDNTTEVIAAVGQDK